MTTARILCRATAFTLLVSWIVLAPATAHEHEGHGEAAMAVSADVEAILINLAQTGAKLKALAEAMPADKFSWAPTEGVRTVSEVFMHVVGTNLLLPPALGAEMPEGVEMTGEPFAMMAQWEATVTAKDDVIAKLDASMEYVGKALASIKDLDTEVTLFGPPAPKRAYFLILLGHAHEHLGQSIAYARTAGVTPPWSQPLPTDDEVAAPAEGGAGR